MGLHAVDRGNGAMHGGLHLCDAVVERWPCGVRVGVPMRACVAAGEGRHAHAPVHCISGGLCFIPACCRVEGIVLTCVHTAAVGVGIVLMQLHRLGVRCMVQQ